MPSQNTANLSNRLGMPRGNLNGHLRPYTLDWQGGVPIKMTTCSSGGVSYTNGIIWCPSNNKLYTAGYSTTVGVLDPVTQTIITNISTGGFYVTACYCPSNNRIYAGGWNGSTLSVINPMTNSVATSISGPSPTPWAIGTVYSSANDKVYSSYYYSSNIYRISPASNSIEATISITGRNYIGTMCYCPSTATIFIGCVDGNYVTAYNVNSGTFQSVTVDSGLQTRAMCYCPLNDMVYYGIYSDATLRPLRRINPRTLTVETLVGCDTNYCSDMCFNPARGLIYIPSNNNVYILDPIANKIVQTVAMPTSVTSACYCPLNQFVYIGESAGSTTYIFS